MAWTTPRTYTTSEVLTASILNTHWRDNFDYLYSPPSCRVYRTTNQTLTTGVSASITFDAEQWDTDTMHSTSSNTERVIYTTAGRYVTAGCASFSPNATGFRRAQIIRPGVETYARSTATELAALACVLPVVAIRSWTAAQFSALECHQTSGGNLDVVAEGGWSPHLMAHWMGN